MIRGFKNVNVYVEGLGIVKKSIEVKDGKIFKIADKIENDQDFITLDDDKIVLPNDINPCVSTAVRAFVPSACDTTELTTP